MRYDNFLHVSRTYPESECRRKDHRGAGRVLWRSCAQGPDGPPASSRKARRERTHRLILLGAWVLARREVLEELRDLVMTELARFIEQGQRVDRHKALLKDLLGK